MHKRNREINIFSLSAIDLFCSAMGAILMLSIILMPYYLRPKNPEELQQQLADATARAQEAEARAKAAEARAAAAEAEAARAAAAAAKAAEGLDIQVPLGLKVAWKGRGVDLDLYVQKDNDVVWARQTVTRWGVLTRDENTTRSEDNQEAFFIPRFTKGLTEGSYKVYVAFFDWPDRNEGTGPFAVEGNLFLFPGTAAEKRHPFQFQVSRSQTWDSPDGSARLDPADRRCPLALEFEITLPAGSDGERDEEFQIRVLR